MLGRPAIGSSCSPLLELRLHSHKSEVNMLVPVVVVKLLLLLTLIVMLLPLFPCSADTDFQQLQVEQLLLYNTVHGEGTWINANESEYVLS